MIVIDNFPFLKKNYKSQTTFAIKNLGLKLVSIKANDDGNVVEELYENGTKVLLEYDLNNNIISETWNKNNEVVYCEKHQYDFNKNGFLEKSYFAQFNGEATNSNWQLIEEYDEDGNLISVKKDYEGDGNIDFTEEYDPVLASRTKTIYDSKGKIINVQHYEYDFDGKLISVQYDKDGDGTIEYKKKYQ